MKKRGFGCMRLPLTNQDDPTAVDHGQFCEMVDHFIEQGFVYFDTAYFYHQGHSESALHRVLVERYPHDAYLVPDKRPTWMIQRAEDYERFSREQLDRTGLDYFDNYLLHNIGNYNYGLSEKYGGFQFLCQLTELDGIRAELTECLSPDGMQKYLSPVAAPVQEVAKPDLPEVAHDETYRFGAKNVRISIAGFARRSGATVTACNLAAWINAHGGTACYLEHNSHRHLVDIVKLYGQQPEGNHYTIGDIDFYMTDELDKNYNFIVQDCGVLADSPQRAFIDGDARVLCGSSMPYEIRQFQAALAGCGQYPILPVSIATPEDLRPLMKSLHQEMRYANVSHSFFDGKANHKLN